MPTNKTYEAFISYRQHPIDTRIAKEVQSRIEHYKIPKDIQAKTGRKEFRSVFRDSSDLSGAADLPEAIAEALEASDWLLVICSERTRLSVWVLREIEMFLQTHSRDHILTVLVDGEPKEVIPEILQREEVTVTHPDGSRETIIRQLEPLSADLRQKRASLRKAEITRLAARFLDCSFDDLFRREVRYRHRRNLLLAGTLFLLMTAAFAYLWWSNRQITANYEETVQQRVFNAETLENEYLEKGMRISALKTGLSALEHLSESEILQHPSLLNGLEKAVGLYELPTKGSPENLVNTQEFTLEGTPHLLAADPDGKYLFVADSLHNLMLWSLERQEPVFSVSTEEIPYSLLMTDNGYALAVCTREVICFDTETGHMLWRQKFLQDFVSVFEGEGNEIRIFTDEAFLRLNARTGDILSRDLYASLLPESVFLEAGDHTVCLDTIHGYDSEISPRWLLMRLVLGNEDLFPWNASAYIETLFDLKRHQLHLLDENWGHLPDELDDSMEDIFLTDSGDILRSVPSADASKSFLVYRFDKEKGLLWRTNISTIPYPVDISQNVNYHNEKVSVCADKAARRVFALYNHTLAILHMDSGEILSSYNLSAAQMLSDSDGRPFFILEGAIGCLDENDALLLRKLPFGTFDDSLWVPSKDHLNKTALLAFVKDKNIYIFGQDKMSEDFFLFSESACSQEGIQWLLAGDSLLEYQQTGTASYLRKYRPGNVSPIWSKPVSSSKYNLVGLDSSEKYLLLKYEELQYYAPPVTMVLRVSLDTGETTFLLPSELAPKDEDNFDSMNARGTLLGGQEGKVIYHIRYSNGYTSAQSQTILISDPDTGERREFPVPFDIAGNKCAKVFSASEILCLSDRGDLFIIDTVKEEASYLGEMALVEKESSETLEPIGAFRAFCLANGSYGVFQESGVEFKIISKEGLELLKLRNPVGILSANEQNGTLALLCADGALWLYDSKTGNLLGTVELHCNVNFWSRHPEGFPLYFLSDTELLVTCHRGCYVVDLPHLTIRSEVPTGLGYSPSLDGYFVGVPTDISTDQKFGFIRRITTEELLQYARELYEEK